MKWIITILFSASFVFWSCGDESEDLQATALNHLRHALDSIKAQKLIASYFYGDGFSLIFTEKDSSKEVYKYTCRNNFPPLLDSLFEISPGKYRSKKYQYLYLVTDSSVSEIFLRKIVHPSSNWQGQTPGQDSVVTKYQRTDKKP
jgi:hypothetical protein